MKYLLNIPKYFAVLFGGIILLNACTKVKTAEPMGDAGSTFVKFINGGQPGLVKYAIDFVPVPITLTAADLRRDAPNNAELNKAITVVIKDDTAALRTYFPDLIYLPAAWYTIGAATPKVGGIGGTFTLTLQPGEFAKQIQITIPDATVLNPSANYGLAFTIISSDAGSKLSESKTVVMQVGAKNSYDGKYTLTFTNYHPTSNPGYTGDVTEAHMVTTGGNKCKLYWPLASAFCAPAILGGGFSYFGAQEPEFTFNTTTNAVTVQNAFPGAATFYTMAVGFSSRYEPATKTIYAKWGYSYAVPGVFDAGCREWTQTFAYLGPR